MRVRRLVPALFMVGAVLMLVGRPAPASATAARATSGSGPGVQLLAQTPWVQTRGQFGMRLHVSAATPATDQIEVSYFPRLITRTNFDAAAAGKVRSYPTYTAYRPLSELTPDPAGGVDVQIPVNVAPPAGSPFGELSTGSVPSAVYPVQVSVVDQSHTPEGPPLTTFVVYASTTVTPLSVAVVIPVGSPAAVSSSGRLEGPTSAQAAQLKRLAATLGSDHTVPASLLSLPRTLAALKVGAAAGSATDRSALSALAAAPQGGLLQVLPSSFSPVAPGTLISAGLGGEAAQQWDAGTAELKSVYGTAPATGTWAGNGPLDAATAGFLAARHVTSLIVPSSDLTTYSNRVTFASATWLESGSNRFQVVAADPQLSTDFSADQPPVLAANHLLAELAMIQTEQPSNSRGVVAMPPAGASVGPELVSTLLAGLDANPLLRPVTASGLFHALPQPEVTRQLANPQPGPGRAGAALAQAARAIQSARQDITGLSSLLTDQAPLATLNEQLLTAESPDIRPAVRSALLGAINREKTRVTGRISLPGSTTITLTATKGQLPITILSARPTRAKVQLELKSQRLIFRPASPPGGTCTVPIPTREVCTFSLNAQNTTLHVPVETRSSGVFPLLVKLRSANGMLQLASNRDTVRSTAVSGVGIVLIVVTILSLALWWGRDLRHGRRPRQMAPAPDAGADPGSDPDPGSDNGPGPGPGSGSGSGVELGGDPVVDEFFNSEPPQFDSSGRRGG